MVWKMRVFELNGAAEQRQRIADELRQLKVMSKGLRTKSLRALMKRHAAARLEAAKRALPVKVPAPAVAA